MEQNTKKQQDKRESTKKKWATFTYYNPTIRKITNIFKHMDIRISYKTNNTIAQILRTKPNNRDTAYNKSRVYKLTCKTCQHSYVGQTSWNLKQRHENTSDT
jgi:hypothetical protein